LYSVIIPSTIADAYTYMHCIFLYKKGSRKMGGFIQRRCARCEGNVYLDKDQYGWYVKCLQCGHTSDLRPVNEFDVDNGKVDATHATASKVAK